MFDMIIRNGQVIDGTGVPARKADVGITDGKILAIEELSTAKSIEVIDASGQVVCPGFIDVHVHSDVMMPSSPLREEALSQGITTEILGPDGLSYSPLSGSNLRTYAWYLSRLNGYPSIDWDWETVAEFRSRLDGTVGVNTVYHFPHAALRLGTVGFHDVPLAGRDLEKAKRLLAEGFEQGAVAFSTGLSYYPNSWSTTEELIGLCNVAAQYGRPFVTHTRTVFRKPVEDWWAASAGEAIEIGCRSGAAVHFSHTRTSPRNVGCLDELLAPIEHGLELGLDITVDCYPYPSGSGFLMFFLPSWAHEGGPEALLRRVSDRHTRKRMAEDMKTNLFPPQPTDVITYVKTEKNAWAMGKSFEEIREAMGCEEIYEALLLLMHDEGLTVGYRGGEPDDPTVVERLNEDFIDLILRPYYMVGSDSIHVGTAVHPRTYGTFPRFIRIARELRRSDLPTPISRMTATPAARFGLRDRGSLNEGKAADVVVFSPDAITDRATYMNPRCLATGVSHVLVNGQIALKEGKATGILAGKSLAV